LLLNLENDAALDLLAESGRGDRHLILANGQAGERVVAVGVGGGGPDKVGGHGFGLD